MQNCKCGPLVLTFYMRPLKQFQNNQMIYVIKNKYVSIRKINFSFFSIFYLQFKQSKILLIFYSIILFSFYTIFFFPFQFFPDPNKSLGRIQCEKHLTYVWFIFYFSYFSCFFKLYEGIIDQLYYYYYLHKVLNILLFTSMYLLSQIALVGLEYYNMPT